MSDRHEKEWSLETFLELLKRQVSELEGERTKLHYRNKSAKHNRDIQQVASELQSFRRILNELESELKGDSADG